MDGNAFVILAGVATAIISALGAWAASRSASRVDMEKDAYNRARELDTETIKRLKEKVAELELSESKNENKIRILEERETASQDRIRVLERENEDLRRRLTRLENPDEWRT